VNTHPTHEELFDAAADGATGPHGPHLDACADCRAAYARLRAGAALLDEARADDLDAADDIDWGRIDGAIQAAAERTAADIRSGSLRAPTRWGAYAAGAVALAAAAVGVVYVKSQRPVDAPPSLAAPTPAPGLTPPVAPTSSFEGAVLLAAGGASQTPAGGASVRFSGGTGVREGARVETGAAGRAVFAVQRAVTLDVRAASDVTLTAMRDDATTVTLARGEVAVDRAGDVGAVSVRAGRWSVAVEGDATVRAESQLVRVVLLAGRATATANGGMRTSFTGPVVLELPAMGDARAVPGDAVDALRLDLGLLRPDGTMWALPAINPAATVTLRGHGALPSSIEAVRLGGPATLEARIGREVHTLEVGTGRVLEWRRTDVVASAAPVAPRHVAPRALPTPALAAAPAPEGRDLTQAEINAMSRRISARIGHCFTLCREQNTCREPHGVVVFDVAADGATSLGTIDPSVAAARTCLARETQFVRFPATGGSFPFQFTIR